MNNKQHLVVFDPAPPSREYIVKALKDENTILTAISPIENFSMKNNFDFHIQKNYFDIEEILCSLKKMKKVDAVICFHQAAINFANQLAHKLKVKPLWKNPDINLANKKIVNNIWEKNELNTPKNFSLSKIRNKHSIIWPIVVKPCEFQGSIGVKKCNNYEELITWTNKLNELQVKFDSNKIEYEMVDLYQSDTSPFIQELIVSDKYSAFEYSAEVIVQNGNIQIIGIIEKDIVESAQNYFLESTFIFPSTKSLENYYNEIEKYISSLEILNSFVHFEFKIVNGKVMPIELNCRLLGEPMAQIVAHNLKLDFSKVLRSISFGDKVYISSKTRGFSGFLFIHPPEELKYKECFFDTISLHNNFGMNLEWISFLEKGDKIIFEDSMHSHPIGYFKFKTNDRAKVIKLKEEIRTKINVICV